MGVFTLFDGSPKNITMSFKDWIEYATLNYDIVSNYYNKRVYEAMVTDPATGNPDLVQLTLSDVFNKCEGTNLENAIRSVIMKCVYTGEMLDQGVRKVMDEYYEV